MYILLIILYHVTDSLYYVTNSFLIFYFNIAIRNI